VIRNSRFEILNLESRISNLESGISLGRRGMHHVCDNIQSRTAHPWQLYLSEDGNPGLAAYENRHIYPCSVLPCEMRLLQFRFCSH
jgi:hypothetical protein